MDPELIVILMAITSFWLLGKWHRFRKPNPPIYGEKVVDFEVIDVSSEYVYLRTDAGSMIDYGLREDMDVRGVGRQTLIGHDQFGMVFQIRVKDGEEPEKVAKRLMARHSMRVNPTTDWSDRDDFKTLLDD